MHLALFGATGATGKLLTQGALARGHTLTALVRNPAGYPFPAQVSSGQIKIVHGDAFNAAAVAQTLTGADAVLSALGARSLKREDVLERAVPLIVQAMGAAHLKRIVVLGSSGALPSALDKQPAYRKWIVETVLYNTLLKWPVASQRAQYAALAASDLDWTMVMPPMLTNRPATRKPGGIRIDPDALPRNGSQIARADVAHFMLEQLNSPTWLRKGVYLTW
jgi:putative NADH-flavin reductase